MNFDGRFNRREVMKWGLISSSAPVLASGASALAQNLGPGNAFVGDETGRDAGKLFTGHPVVGGGPHQVPDRTSGHAHSGRPETTSL